MRTVALSLLCAVEVLAGEYAILENGFRVRAQSHETRGELTLLHTETGTLEMPSKTVQGFEVEEYVPPKLVEPAAPATAPATPSAPVSPQQMLEAAAKKHGLRPEFVGSVAAIESALRANAVSPKGAIGLMQLMPGTAKELGADPHNPAENAEAGARYLRQLLERYRDTADPVRLALAAYNAGPGAVDRHRNIPPYRETQAYVEKVLRKYLAELKRRT